jgi:hypothetical protein
MLLEALPACYADQRSVIERARGTWQHAIAFDTLLLSSTCRSVEQLPQVMQMACTAAMLPCPICSQSVRRTANRSRRWGVGRDNRQRSPTQLCCGECALRLLGGVNVLHRAVVGRHSALDAFQAHCSSAVTLLAICCIACMPAGSLPPG